MLLFPYESNLELQRDILNVGLTHGMWNVCTYYMCEEEADFFLYFFYG